LVVFQLQHHGGHSLHGWILPTLSLRAGHRGRGYFKLQCEAICRMCGRTNAVTAMAAAHGAQCQRLASTAMMPPPAVAAEAMLVAVREHLNNPPPLNASPSVVEQWCHDVDQLIITAINMLPLGG
jgi:hypothetical protein